jgi:hypothetical protein
MLFFDEGQPAAAFCCDCGFGGVVNAGLPRIGYAATSEQMV